MAAGGLTGERARRRTLVDGRLDRLSSLHATETHDLYDTIEDLSTFTELRLACTCMGLLRGSSYGPRPCDLPAVCVFLVPRQQDGGPRSSAVGQRHRREAKRFRPPY